LRCIIGSTESFKSWLAAQKTLLKPSFEASLIRASVWATFLTSPESPTSPKKILFAGRDLLAAAEIRAASQITRQDT
jgi:hypothetical protein